MSKGKIEYSETDLESELKRAVFRMMRKEFPKVWYIKTADKYTSGIPDLLMVINGGVLFVELKTPKGKVHLIQSTMIRRIEKANGLAQVCRSVEEVRDVVNRAIHRYREIR